ncbi:hypothetical protein ACHAWF_017835 [Thalassiosira exigua]
MTAEHAEPNWEEIGKDKEAKKRAVLSHVASRCTADSDVEDLRTMGTCLADGGALDASILTGGLFNYTYKISCRDASGAERCKLFAKLTFPYGVLFPDKPCPLSRTENEWKMMTFFHELRPGMVAVPYFCDDVGTDMKLLATQWSPVDEQMGNQFIDGSVDGRLAATIADGIFKLHSSQDLDTEFNSEMKPFFESLNPILESIITGLHDQEDGDRVGALAKEAGREKTTEMFDAFAETYNASDCLIHGDLHAFNVMVGAKPSPEKLERFEPSGRVVLCDFEMAHAGTAGWDVGSLRSFPVACALAHSINGHDRAATECLDWLDAFWSSYEGAMRDAGKSEEDVAGVYRQSLRATACYLLAYYGINVHMEFLPIDEGNTEDLGKVKEGIGAVGFKCLRWSVDDSLSYRDLAANYKGAIEEEMDRLRSAKKVRRSRRSSVLRASGRRVSDANLFVAGLDRMSIGGSDRSILLKMESLLMEDDLSAEVGPQ